ncbi:AAA family ATPase [Amycolatopsis dendrobii]|uniref:AAA family ATPase n=1 Tax=Amycolatopsis dendrobii TaxID=2760662 RepID=A0A7W3W4N2_9PSEU|nr:AAA family ATPase [Amycolatopsis dendrobii]MBB1158659.1 AAA family ATPase [Amycolatopsis dendrobii]
MKIHYVHLRNFRGVTDRRVDFADSGVTVVEGSNEVGKTSMVEAIDLLLKSPDSAKTSHVLAVQSKGVDIGPEVEAEITAGQYRFVYRKRWLKRPETTLRVNEPAPADLTGREAHDRVKQILEETLDDGLWAALRVEQNQPISQSALGGNDSLARALDAAGGGARETGGESTLFERVERELEKYWTPGGKPKAELKAAAERRAEAEGAVAFAEASLREVERDVERHAVVARELQDLAAGKVEQESELGEWERRRRDLDEQRALVASLADRFKAASAEAETVAAAVAQRRELVSAVAAQEHAVEATGNEVFQVQATADLAQGLTREAAAALNATRLAFDEATLAERRAADDVHYLRDQAELDNLERRESRAVEAIRQRDSADAFLAVCALDEAGFAELESAYAKRREAQAVLEAGAPTVALDAFTTLDLIVNGERTALAAGASMRQSVTDVLELVFPDLAAVRIEPGGGQDLKQAAENADAEYQRRCTDLAVSDIAEARDVIAARRATEGSRREAEHALELALEGRTLDDLRSDRVRLSARVGARADVGDLPADLESATAVELDTRAQAESARRKLSDAADLHQERQAAETEAAKTAIALSTRWSSMQEQLQIMREELASARIEDTDESLTAKLADAQAARSDARLALEGAEANLAAQDPDTVEARVAAAHEWGSRLQNDHDARTSELDKLTGRLDLAGSEGRQDRLDQARTAQEEADRQYDNLYLRANAARLLYEKLRDARETAKQAYVKPFRDQIERLGRIVFGQSLKLDIDSDLRIANRTLNGVTVGYDDLSTGAREQLCIVSRLACAALIDPVDGAPVIIDDALGHSDPDRLARMGAVFAAANSKSQIIVLTCTPDRYRRVGAATVIPVQADEPRLIKDIPEHEASLTPADAILTCLEREGRQIGKAEIIRRSGIDDTQWGPAIRSLLEQEQVQKTGDRRGAVYSINR